jgi:hypothetical protein
MFNFHCLFEKIPCKEVLQKIEVLLCDSVSLVVLFLIFWRFGMWYCVIGYAVSDILKDWHMMLCHWVLCRSWHFEGMASDAVSLGVRFLTFWRIDIWCCVTGYYAGPDILKVWHVILCHWVCGFWHFEGLVCDAVSLGIMQVLTFWRFGMWYCVIGCAVSDILKDWHMMLCHWMCESCYFEGL